MFNNTKIKQLSQLLDIEDIKLLEVGLKKQAKYLKVNSTYLLKSYIVMYEQKKTEQKNSTEIDKYTSRNLLINKYKNTILNLYKNEEYGYLKISKYLSLHHNVSVSKSSIENFIKSNNITRDS